VTRFAAVRSTGIFVPGLEVTNATLRERFAQSAPEVIGKLEASTGIRTRWVAPDDWATSDLAVRAARDALARAGVEPGEVDLVVLGTDSPDYVTPCTSVIVQHELRATRAGTFDVGCACASFPTALAAAAGLMATHGRSATSSSSVRTG
jgi:3-oxoacyl-[acyl-carrier-protein] synthase-3